MKKVLIGLAILAALAVSLPVVGMLWVRYKTQDARAGIVAAHHAEVADVAAHTSVQRLKAARLTDRHAEVTGEVVNGSDHAISSVVLRVLLLDKQGESVQERTAYPLAGNGGLILQPGHAATFAWTFGQIPSAWDGGVRAEVVSVALED